MRLMPMDAGSILVDGEPLSHRSFEKVSFIPDESIMLPSLDFGWKLMDFMKTFYETWNQERANELLRFFRLNPEDKLGHLSKGNNAKANLPWLGLGYGLS